MKNETIGFVTQEVSSEIVGVNRKWRGQIQTTGTVTKDQYFALVGAEANRSAADVEYVLNCAELTKRKLLRQGYYLTIGNVSFFPVLAGGFEKPDAVFDPKVNRLLVAAVPRSGLKDCLADITPVNLVETPMPIIQSVMDKETGKEGEIVIGHVIYVAGRNLAIDLLRPDERTAWFESLAGEKVAEGVVTASDLQSADVTFETWPEPGEYRLCLSTRAGLPEEYSLKTVRKTVVVVNA